MVKENSEKKWLAVLVILVVLVLVVELLSLNVLYRLADKNNLQGQLAVKKPRDPCEVCQKTKNSCIHYCDKKNPTSNCYIACYADYDSCLYSYNCQN